MILPKDDFFQALSTPWYFKLVFGLAIVAIVATWVVMGYGVYLLFTIFTSVTTDASGVAREAGEAVRAFRDASGL